MIELTLCVGGLPSPSGSGVHRTMWSTISPSQRSSSRSTVHRYVWEAETTAGHRDTDSKNALPALPQLHCTHVTATIVTITIQWRQKLFQSLEGRSSAERWRTECGAEFWIDPETALLVDHDHRLMGQFFLSHLCPKFFSTTPEKTTMLTCKITLPDSLHPVIISKNPGFRAIYLARWNEFRFFFI